MNYEKIPLKYISSYNIFRIVFIAKSTNIYLQNILCSIFLINQTRFSITKKENYDKYKKKHFTYQMVNLGFTISCSIISSISSVIIIKIMWAINKKNLPIELDP